MSRAQTTLYLEVTSQFLEDTRRHERRAFIFKVSFNLFSGYFWHAAAVRTTYWILRTFSMMCLLSTPKESHHQEPIIDQNGKPSWILSLPASSQRQIPWGNSDKAKVVSDTQICDGCWETSVATWNHIYSRSKQVRTDSSQHDPGQ